MGRHKKIKEDSTEESEKDIDIDEEGGSAEEATSKENELKFVSSGSTNLNLVLSGDINKGYPIGRIINIVGDKSSGKTLLAIEVINYAHHILSKRYDIKMIYNETEAAFDKDLAKQLSMPIDKVDFRNSSTVEDWYEDLNKEISLSDKYDLTIYILDSLDALSNEGELNKDFNEGSYGTQKAKQLSKLFRQLIRKIEKKNILLIIISQIRDKLNVSFGETKTRSGGRALDFYASIILWLAEIGKIKKENIPIGIEIKAKVKKNKIYKPFRETSFEILFNYGISDLDSMVSFLKENKKIDSQGPWLVFMDKKYKGKEDLISFIEKENLENEIKLMVKTTWDEIEERIKVTRKPKYLEK